MTEKKRLRRERQCAKCPWRVSTDPNTIPGGYCSKKHAKLKSTIAEPGAVLPLGRAMACHESKKGDEDYCVGWLMNQLGPGNNIGLRLKMLRYDLSRVETIGDQHLTLEETLP